MRPVTRCIVVIPAYNEAETLTSLFDGLKKYVPLENIIVADDGSIDETKEVTLKNKIKLIRNPKNRGKGEILKKTFNYLVKTYSNRDSNNVWVITMDADGQHSPSDIQTFYHMIDKHPSISVFIGSRDYTNMPLKNYLSNYITTLWCNWWMEWEITDLQCGYRCYSLPFLKETLSKKLQSSHFDFETEILMIGWLLGRRYKSVPIKTIYKASRQSRVKIFTDTLRWSKLMLRYGFTRPYLRKLLYWKFNSKKQF